MLDLLENQQTLQAPRMKDVQPNTLMFAKDTSKDIAASSRQYPYITPGHVSRKQHL